MVSSVASFFNSFAVSHTTMWYMEPKDIQNAIKELHKQVDNKLEHQHQAHLAFLDSKFAALQLRLETSLMGGDSEAEQAQCMDDQVHRGLRTGHPTDSKILWFLQVLGELKDTGALKF